MQVEWLGGLGYGDFATGLAYSHNCCVKYEQPIEFLIHWQHDVNYRHNPEDPETAIERCNYIYSLFNKPQVTLNHSFHSTPEYRFKNNFFEFNPVHGIYNLELPKKNEKFVLMWTSETNTVPIDPFKDPLSTKDWIAVESIVKDFGYDVIRIDYRTPIAEVIDLMCRCTGGVGYNGCIQQFFKLIHKPLIVFNERFDYNKLIMPWGTNYASLKDFFEVENLFDESLDKMKYYLSSHDKFIHEKADPTKEKLYNIVI